MSKDKNHNFQPFIPEMRDEWLNVTSHDEIIHKEQLQQLEQKYELLQLRYRALSQDYHLLANSKTGRITLWYWKQKDKIKRWAETLSCSRVLRRKRYEPIQSEDLLPDISVIIPTYRETPFVYEAVESVLTQDYPKEKLAIFLVVNGTNKEYFKLLQAKYQNYHCIRVLHTEKQGVGVARNFGLTVVDTECVCYLDDDDAFTKGYLRLMASYMYQDVTIVCGPLCDYDMNTSVYDSDTYINRALSAVGTGAYRQYAQLTSLFSSLPAKLYRTDLLRECRPIDESVKNTEDVIFWAENYSVLRGNIYLCEVPQKECYVRRLTMGSLSRPLNIDAMQFYVMDRLTVLQRLEMLSLGASSIQEKQFIQSKIRAQRALMEGYLSALEKDQRDMAEAMLQKSISQG